MTKNVIYMVGATLKNNYDFPEKVHTKKQNQKISLINPIGIKKKSYGNTLSTEYNIITSQYVTITNKYIVRG